MDAMEAARGTAAPIDDRARGPILAGFAILAAFFLGLGGWAAFAPLDSAAVAQAVIKIEGNRKSVQHLEGGIVRELRVREGDRVEAGKVVVVLDDTQIRATVDVLSKQHAELAAQEARLAAERDGAAQVRYPAALLAQRREPDIAAVLDGQDHLFRSRRSTLLGQIDVLRKKAAQAREQATGLEGQLAAYRRQRESTLDENAGLRDLYRKGYVPRQRMLELERAEAALDGQIADTTSAIVRARQLVEELNLQVMQVQSDRLAQISADLRDVQARQLEIGPRLNAARETLRRTEIRSPYAGRVVGLAVFSVGGVISAGERIMDVVPDEEAIVVEATVAPEDIKDVRAGMRAEVHLTAYKQRTVPIVRGTLTQVSADRLTDARSGVGYYLVHVRLDEAELAALPHVRLTPGMPALVMIPTGSRTALDYLLRPLYESLVRSFREK